jgi:death-on-curing protein
LCCKRTAWTALVVFLDLNGTAVPPSEVEAAVTMLEIAAGMMTDGAFIAWVRRHAVPA